MGPRFVPSPVQAAQATRCLPTHCLQVQRDFSPPCPRLSFRARPIRCALCLFWGADLWLRPSRRMSTIQNLRKSLVRNWKPVCSLVGDALSGAKFAPFWLWLAPASPLHPAGDGPVRSQLALLWYCSALRPVNGLAVPWVRAFHSLILSLLLSHSLGCCLTLVPSNCPQAIQAQSLPQAVSPALLRSAPTCWWWI